MPGWIAGAFLVIAGFITGLFVERDALNFEIIKMVVAVLLFTFLVLLIAFWPMLKKWFMNRKNKK